MAIPENVADTLRAARAVIEDPSCWTTGARARDSFRRPTHPASPDAIQFCMLGALVRVDGPYEKEARAALAATVRGGIIETFNDTVGRRHKTVLAKFDQAIATAGQAG